MKKPRRRDLILSLRLEPDLAEFIKHRAAAERRTYASLVRFIIAQAARPAESQEASAA